MTGLAGFVDVKLPVEFSLLLNGDFSESAGIARREQVAQVIAAIPTPRRRRARARAHRPAGAVGALTLRLPIPADAS